MLEHLIGGGLSKYGIGLQCRSRHHTQTHHEKIVSPVRRGRVVGMRWTRKSTHSARHEHTQSCQFAGLACHSHACLWTQRTIIYPKRPWSRRLDDATSFSHAIRPEPSRAFCSREIGCARTVAEGAFSTSLVGFSASFFTSNVAENTYLMCGNESAAPNKVKYDFSYQ